MSALLRGFGAGAEEADRIAAAITDFSRPATNAVLDDVAFLAYAQDGRAYGPKAGPFETVLELDQVIGMRPELLQADLSLCDSSFANAWRRSARCRAGAARSACRL